MANAFTQIPKEFVSKTEFYDYAAPAAGAIEKISSLGAVIVNRNGTFYGIVDERSVSRRGTGVSRAMHIGSFAENVPVLNGETSLESVIAHFYNTQKKALPYAENDRVSGIVRREKILSSVLSIHMLSKYIVKDLMSSPLLAINASANAAQAKSAMQNYHVRRLVVIDSGKLYGILTYRQVSELADVPNERPPEMKNTLYSLKNTEVRSICVRNVQAIDQGKPAEVAIRSMLKNNVSSLVVLRGDKPAGIITVRDILEGVVAGISKVKRNIIISGLDRHTKEYEEELKEGMSRLADRINRFHRINTEYMAVHIKHPKTKNYEMHARMISEDGGAISASSSGYSLDEAFKLLSERVYKLAKERKEMMMTDIKSEMGHYVPENE
jgi:CBS domain-containing protein